MSTLASAAGREASARLGRYDLGPELGSGGMGSVVEATHRALGKRVAIKRFHPHLAARSENLTRFVREGRAVARLRHPHIVEVFDLDETEDGAPYLVMELLEGCTLAEYLARSRPLSLTDAIELILPLVSALEAAHAAGIVHRDVKPSNIFLRNRLLSDPCLVDFGVSKHAGQVAIEEITQSGTIIGSYPYFSPEHTRGAKHVTAQSDLYSLAAVLYECTTGATPFEGESAYELMHTIATKDVKPPSLVRAALPRELDDVIARAMDRDPLRRYPTMRSFGFALLSFADKRTWHTWATDFIPVAPDRASPGSTVDEDAPPAEAPVARRRRLRPAQLLAPVLTLALLCTATLFLRRTRHDPATGEVEAPALANVTAASQPVAPSVSSAPVEAARPGAESESAVPADPPPATPRPARQSRAPAGHPHTRETAVPSPRETGSNGVPIFD